MKYLGFTKLWLATLRSFMVLDDPMILPNMGLRSVAYLPIIFAEICVDAEQDARNIDMARGNRILFMSHPLDQGVAGAVGREAR